MTGKALALASAACALALAAAGCGGNGTVAGTTTSGQGGVLGAQANLTRTRANVEIARVQAILNGSLGRLMHTRSAKQASRLATQASARLRAEAGRIQALDVPPDAVQARQNLVSSIQSLATDLDTVKGDLQSGDLKSAVRAGTHLSSVIAVRASLKSFRAALQGG
jgi:hypothetical protein